MNMEVTKRIEFECCYIYNQQLEAHNCKLEVTVEGPQRFNDSGRVMSYENLSWYMKQVVPHKAFLYWDKDLDGISVGQAFAKVGCRVESYAFPISAENLCKCFADSLQDLFDEKEPGIRILDMKFREDNNSFVSWKKEP